ncbi:hypothetical protein ACWFZ6_23750 [Methylorubrum extorquens]|jgi:hypothetical protein|uniref:hypothetical protein n=1 Tax=Methylorubrum TaxID=2282523 RepID=UPI0020A1A502|nr:MULTISPECIES: hypothetical protein [Methylorubrum]MDF9861352.1 hypothetical protein [Methylorubrum pseudosasae]MDH6634979.1 hypothetical protein [Methylobacterium sp. SuP10 SLI 274]MDH6664150.1 hypothetical protein [Methylorubrum zatmanii]MCP1561155.1 hypothetical protein [Methylorubrum extorquens]MDF9789637.1 hypothetical protein [Methylorubrum extorquens]
MTRVLLLAALALACVASPALAFELVPGPSRSGGTISLVGGTVSLFDAAISMRRARLGLAVSAFGVFVAMTGASIAAELGTIGDKAVILPWGDWLVALAVSLREPILTILLPIIAAYIIQAIRKVYPWAALFLSQRRVEMMLEAAVDFGLDAVNGAAKGKTLSVNVAVPVIAKGTQYVIDTAPPAVIKAAGGADGIAARIFRKLDLDDHASEAAVLVPAQEQVADGTADADELRRMDEMTRR